MNTNCLSDQDLTLLYYGEADGNRPLQGHLDECSACGERFAALRNDLERLPQLDYPEHPATATRIAACVTEQLQKPRRRWLPAISTAAVSACALIVALLVWTPQPDQPQVTYTTVSHNADMAFDEEMPDIEFLEEMDLLLELDLLSQVEGV